MKLMLVDFLGWQPIHPFMQTLDAQLLMTPAVIPWLTGMIQPIRSIYTSTHFIDIFARRPHLRVWLQRQGGRRRCPKYIVTWRRATTWHWVSTRRHVNIKREFCCFELKEALCDITSKCKNLLNHHENAKKQISTLKNQLKSADQQLEALKDPKFLGDDQKILAKQSSRGLQWSMSTLKQALQVKFTCGTTTDELVRTLGYPLPSTRTLMRRLQSFLPGVLKEVFDALRKKADTMEEAEYVCPVFRWDGNSGRHWTWAIAGLLPWVCDLSTKGWCS